MATPTLSDLRYIWYGGGSAAEYAFLQGASAAGISADDLMRLGYNGTGSPEGLITAPVGSEYTDLNNGNKYSKTSGTGNTGWVLIGSGAVAEVVNANPLRWWRAKLGRRAMGKRGGSVLPDVANIWVIGDSVLEGAGQRSDYDVAVRNLHWAIQRTFRSGGFGFVPCARGTATAASAVGADGIPWGWTTNPLDPGSGTSLYTWSFGGANNIFNWGDQQGYGVGRLGINISGIAGGAGTATISGECDSVWIHYCRGAFGIMQVVIDAGTSYAQTLTLNPALVAGMYGSGGVWEIIGLPPGIHTFTLSSTSTGFVLEGITFFYTDRTVGVHMFNGSHSGYTTAHYDAHDFKTRIQYELGIQPNNPVYFTNVVSTVLGSPNVIVTAGAFTNDDIGEFFWNEALADPLNIPMGAKVLAVTDATHIVLDKNALATANNFSAAINRSTVTVTLVNGSNVVTVTAGALTGADTGKILSGPAGVPANSRIVEVFSPTSFLMSQNATASAGGQALRIKNRVAVNTKPDLILVQLGYNDQLFSLGEDTFKAFLVNCVNNAILRSHCEHTPSIVLMACHAPGSLTTISGNVITTNGSPIITINPADPNGGLSFGPEDVGKTITTVANTPIPAGTTILSYQSETQVTLSQNCVANSAAAYATIVNRLRTDRLWVQNEYTWIKEVAALYNWSFFDLYNLYGWIGDPATASWNDKLLTTDGIHHTDWAAHMLVDQLSILLSGTPENASIPQGISDKAGDLPVGIAADWVHSLPAGQEGQALVSAPSSSIRGIKPGLAYIDPLMKNRIMFEIANAGGVTFTDVGFPAAPIDVGATPVIANADGVVGPALSYTTKVAAPASGDFVGRGSAVLTTYDPRWMPEFFAAIITPPVITNVRLWIGLFSAVPDQAASPAASLAAFRYNTGTDTAGFWTTCTKDGAVLKANLGVAALVANTRYELRIVALGVRGVAPTGYDFYINDVLVATHIVNLPAATKTLGVQLSVTTLNAAQKTLTIERWTVSH